MNRQTPVARCVVVNRIGHEYRLCQEKNLLNKLLCELFLDAKGCILTM